MHMIKLFLQIVRLRFLAKLAYPGAYLTGIVAQWLSYGIEVLLTAVMVSTFGALAGWSAVEIVFLYGVWLLTYAIGASFTFNIANLLPDMAVSGTFDEALTRPVPTLFYLIATNFNVGYISHIVLSLGVIAWSAGRLSLHWGAGQWAWLAALVLCGAVISGSLLLLCELPALRLRARSPLNVLYFEGREFAKYPLAIYPQSLQLLFTSALPFGFIAYYPLSALLGKGSSMAYLSPAVAAALVGITALCWQLTIRRYESAGTEGGPSMPQIELTRVTKDYRVRARDDARGRIAQFVRPRYDVKRAVDGICFSVEPGEMVGYIGPNGAGKSTTIKMLTGILSPTSGDVRAFGRDPARYRRQNAMRMGAVFGQRSQLLWDLPVRDTMDLFKTMYQIGADDYARQRDRLVDMLDMGEFLNQATRQLSLGQRMRANLALCFLYNPDVVYLDEPTIGLDVLVKERIRDFLRQINRERGTTVLLTTHDTQDIERVTDRLMLIDRGKLLFDGSQAAFKRAYQGDAFQLEVEFESAVEPMANPALHAVRCEGARHLYQVPYAAMSPGEAISSIATAHRVQDIRVRELGLEDILKRIYAE